MELLMIICCIALSRKRSCGRKSLLTPIKAPFKAMHVYAYKYAYPHHKTALPLPSVANAGKY